MEELEIIEEQNDPEFQALLAAARQDVELGQTLTPNEFDMEFGSTFSNGGKI